MTGLTFVWLVAYDWRRAVEQIAYLWSFGGEHVIGWDRLGLTWGGGHFAPPEPKEIRDHLSSLGIAHDGVTESRLRFVAGDFYRPGAAIGELETNERNALSWVASRGNLIVTLDADEELVNPEALFEWAASRRLPESYSYAAQGLPVYKVLGDVALVFRTVQRIPVALGAPGLWAGPRSCRDWLECPARVINWFLAGRSEAEIALKLGAMSYMGARWSADDLLEQWRSTSLHNFERVHGFADNFGRAGLAAVPLSDLRSGRWAKAGIK